MSKFEWMVKICKRVSAYWKRIAPESFSAKSAKIGAEPFCQKLAGKNLENGLKLQKIVDRFLLSS